MRQIRYVLLPFIATLLTFIALMPVYADESTIEADNIVIGRCDFLAFRIAVMIANATDRDISFECSGTILFTSELTIKGSFTIYGEENIILDGSKKTRLFYIEAGASLTLNKLVVQNGFNDGSYANTVVNNVQSTYAFGGAIQNDGDLTIIGCFFTHNSIVTKYPFSSHGGAISNIGNLTVIGSRFTHNRAGNGGVIFNNGSSLFYPNINNYNGRVIIRNSIFSDNSAESGAVIYSVVTKPIPPNTGSDTSLTALWGDPEITDTLPNIIYNSTFYRNRGSLVSSIGRFEVYRSKFADNLGFLTNRMGILAVYGSEFNWTRGAINNLEGMLYAHHNVFTHGRSANGIVTNNGVALLTHNLFIDNRAIGTEDWDGFGGAIRNSSDNKLILTNSILSDNTSKAGGGAIFNHGQLVIADSLIRNNSSKDGDAIYQYMNSMGIVASQNTHFINNTCVGTLIDLGGNISEGAGGCPGMIPPSLDITLNECDFASLQSAIAELNYYSGTLTITCSEPIIFTEKVVIQHEVTIFGGENAILDGGNMTRLFDITLTGKLTLNGVTFQNGFSHDPEIGTIEYSINNSMWLTVVAGREYQSTSGAIHNSGTLTIINCIFRDNHVIGYGGAIGNSGILTIQDSQFINNSLASVGEGLRPDIGAYGGAIANYQSGEATITNSVFMNNSTLDAGGAIYNVGTITISHSLFSHNVATRGGAIFNYDSLTITDSIFTANDSLREGDAIHSVNNASVLSQNTSYVNDDCSGTVFTDGGGNIARNAYNCPAQEVFDWTDVIPKDARIVSECHFIPLKKAVDVANQEGGEITFTCSGTIYFNSYLTITGDVRINGGENVIFDGNRQQSFFLITSEAKLSLSNLTLQNGIGSHSTSVPNQFPLYNAIINEGNLSLVNIIFTNNRASDGNIYNTATLMIMDSTFADNEAYDGAVIYNTDGGMVSIINSTFSNNRASHWGDVFLNEADSLIMIINSTLSDEATYENRVGIYNNDGTMISQNSTYTNIPCYGLDMMDAGGNTEEILSGCIAPPR